MAKKPAKKPSQKKVNKANPKEESILSGRPSHFESPDALLKKVNEYFNSGLRKRNIIVGKAPNEKVIEIPVPTISGLAYFLGFESRQSFYDYEKYPDFSYIIKRARLFIEVEYEEQLQHGNTTGAIFALKNMGWTDRQELGLDGSLGHSFSAGLNAIDKTLESNPDLKDQLEDDLVDK